MKTLQLLAAGLLLATLGLVARPVIAAEQDGLALAVIYDTSGSMKEQVKDAQGKLTPKYVIANRALEAIARRIQLFATNASANPRPVAAGLFVFQGTGARPAIPLGAFDLAAFQRWTKAFSNPEGGTPLGNSLSVATDALLKSGLTSKHLLILTDGMNTVGPDPAATLPKARQRAAEQGAAAGVHFVAFDVDAKVFAGVKQLGATVVGAANETQLNEQLNFILEKKILLEEEEAPARK